MDLSNPMRSIIPSTHAEVLAVLARTSQPLTGRGVAELAGGRVSQTGANRALQSLARSGLVVAERHPPAILYVLNRRHLAAEAIEGLADLRGRLLEAMRTSISGWLLPPRGAWLFGSAARGTGTEASDIDVLVVRPHDVGEEVVVWLDQVDRLADDVMAWTGNRCEVVEYAEREFEDLMASEARLAADLRSDALPLSPHSLPRRPAKRVGSR